MQQLRFFTGISPLEYQIKTDTVSSIRLRQIFRRVNLSLAGCSSAEPDSVSVQHKNRFQLLYLQTAKFSSHLHPNT